MANDKPGNGTPLTKLETALQFSGQRQVGKRRFRREDDNFLYDLREQVIQSTTIQDSLDHVLLALQSRNYVAPRVYRQKESNIYALVREIGLPEEAKQNVASFDISSHPLLERILTGNHIYQNTNARSEPSLTVGPDDPLYHIQEIGLIGIPYTRHSEIYPDQIRGIIMLNYNPSEKRIKDRELSILEQVGWIVADKVSHLLELQQYQKVNQKLLDQQAKLELQTKLDGPTGLFNKRTFHQDLEVQMEKSNKHQIPYHLMIMDMDHFKDLNDNFGHYEGDKFISQFGAYLCNVPETTPDTICYRIGGDEFAIVTAKHNQQEVIELAQKIKNDIKIIPLPEGCRPISLSIGMVPAKLASTGEDWYRMTDTQCYAAKRGGRNRISYETLQ